MSFCSAGFESPGTVHSDGVVPDGQQWHDIMSGIVRLGVAGNSGPLRRTFTFAPATTEPVLSVTVPEKPAVAWPYRSGQTGNTSEQKTTSSAFLVSIKFPRAVLHRVPIRTRSFPA